MDNQETTTVCVLIAAVLIAISVITVGITANSINYANVKAETTQAAIEAGILNGDQMREVFENYWK